MQIERAPTYPDALIYPSCVCLPKLGWLQTKLVLPELCMATQARLVVAKISNLPSHADDVFQAQYCCIAELPKRARLFPACVVEVRPGSGTSRGAFTPDPAFAENQ